MLKKFAKKLVNDRFLQRYFPIVIVGIIILASILFYFVILKDLPNPQGLKNYKIIPVSSKIYDRKGKLLYEIYRDQKRTPINLSDVPAYVKEATISIEDKDFYHHSGISLFSGIFRALRDTILHNNLQGGSTLTQQLVKSALLSPERTATRKIKEIILALWTEEIFTKDQILEMYLNQVPYGGASYGIEEAAHTYFNKNAHDLTLAQAAYLAGLPQAPSLYSPYYNPDLAQKRQHEVLAQMAQYGYIMQKQKADAEKEEIKITPLKTYIKAPHFVLYVKQILEDEYGSDAVEEGGLQVYTSLDLDLQEKAEQIVKDEIDHDNYLNIGNGAALITRPPTGEILAMVGSKDYFATPSGSFNVVVNGLRQPGSSIKPINYAIGIDRKLVSPASVFLDVPTCFGGNPKYCPVNYDGKFHGPVQLRFALGNSFNIPAVQMLQLNGIQNFVASAPAFLIKSLNQPDRYGLSLTLGGGEVHMTEMAQAFSAFANEGTPREVVSILKVKDKRGNSVYEYKDPNLLLDIHKPLTYPNFLTIPGKRAVSKETAFLISHILLDNNARMIEFGPSSALVVPKHAVSVKTGTTNDFRDNWTIGYTPNFLVAVWVGNNDNVAMNKNLVSGITGAAPIWNAIMSYTLKNQPDLFPRKPDNVVGKQVCSATGQIMTKNPDGAESCPSRFEYMIKGTENVKTLNTGEFESVKQVVPVNRVTGKLTDEKDPEHDMVEKSIIKNKDFFYCLDCNH